MAADKDGIKFLFQSDTIHFTEDTLNGFNQEKIFSWFNSVHQFGGN